MLLENRFQKTKVVGQNVSQVADAPTPTEDAADVGSSRAAVALASAPSKVALRIVDIGGGGAHVDAPVAAWLAAVGLARDEVVTILRRAPFGGPLHLRSAAGAELAVAREIALAIDVEAAE